MNINISYNWLKEFFPTRHKPEDLARLLSLSGPSVERMSSRGAEWDKMVVGEILEIKPHPNADKLRIAVTDIGSKKMEIICGGTNLRKNMKVAVALPGSKVKWHGEGDFVELKPVEIRGVKSEAMIAAANEIGLFEAFPHKEREVMDISGIVAKPGTLLARALELDDVVFDTEITTNRPDLLGMVGFAREAAAITREKIDARKLGVLEKFPPITLKELPRVTVTAKKLCPRYTAARVNGVKVGPSPWWLKRRLMSAGVRPISNIVDITNYVMLEVGQPMHAFDAARLGGGRIIVRPAAQNEKIKALDGVTYKLTPDMLVIADGQKPVAIAGIMGGEESSVGPETEDIILESATFDPVSIRQTSRDLNLRSDSSQRFEKGLSTESAHRALARAAGLVLEIAGGNLGPMRDERAGVYKPRVYPFSFAKAQELIGAPIAAGEMKKILQSLGFGLKGGGKSAKVSVPYFRDHDIESGRDLVEEIARIYGYHKLPSLVPGGAIPLEMTGAEFLWENRIKELFRGAGFNEIITYSFTSAHVMGKMGLDANRALKLWNPLTSEYEYMRTSLVPSALEVIGKNQENFPKVKIFEIANVYYPRANDLPREELNFVAAVSAKSGDPLFLEIKGIFELLASRFALGGLTLQRDLSGASYWHPGRSVAINFGKRAIGALGELHPMILRKFGIEHRVAVLHLALPELFPHMKQFGEYKSLLQFPAAKRDISFVVGEKVVYEKIMQSIKRASGIIAGAELFDVYSGKGVPEGKKSMAFHIVYQSPERTLTSEEVEAAHGALAKMLQKEFGAEVRA